MTINTRKVIYCLCILFMIAYDLNHYQQKRLKNNQRRRLQAKYAASETSSAGAALLTDTEQTSASDDGQSALASEASLPSATTSVMEDTLPPTPVIFQQSTPYHYHPIALFPEPSNNCLPWCWQALPQSLKVMWIVMIIMGVLVLGIASVLHYLHTFPCTHGSVICI